MEANKTNLKTRSNRIFHSLLKKLDPVLHSHLVSQGIQPELILIKWLKCLVSREFDLKSLFEIWDYLFSGFKPELVPLTTTNTDHLHLLDYLSLALIRHSRTSFLQGDYTDCLMIAMKPLDLTEAAPIIEAAELYRRLLRPQDFPSTPLVSLK